MLTAQILSLAFLLPAQPPPLDAEVPKGWPPPPDFKTRIDYLQWWQDRQGGTRQDAAPLWTELSAGQDSTPEEQAAVAALWGQNEAGHVPGLFTIWWRDVCTSGPSEPGSYRWDPADHPDWEQAFLSQEKHGLRARLVDIARRPVFIGEPLSLNVAPPGKEDQGGLTPDDRLLRTARFPSGAAQRQAARVLLQSAWRAPEGRIDLDRMAEAITTCLQITRQLDQGSPMLIGYLVGIAIRGMVYDSALRLLEEADLDASQLRRFEQILRRFDSRDLTEPDFYAFELAALLDTLQFLYEAGPDGRLRPNVEHTRRYVTHVHLWHEEAKAHAYIDPAEPQPDLMDGILGGDGELALRQIFQLFTQARHISRNSLPQNAQPQIVALVADFQNNPETHVLWRQELYSGLLSLPVLGGVQAEARRRATQVVLRIHRHRAETGEWLATLRHLQNFPPKWRTDPFSGKDFIYRFDPESFRLYSVAMNGEDDWGVHDERWGVEYSRDPSLPLREQLLQREIKKADYVFWPIRRE